MYGKVGASESKAWVLFDAGDWKRSDVAVSEFRSIGEAQGADDVVIICSFSAGVLAQTDNEKVSSRST